MARAVQVAPAPHQLDAVELPDDGAVVIETNGIEVLDVGAEAVDGVELDGLDLLDGPASVRANDNNCGTERAPAPPRVVPFASTLKSIR
jgi:hypothetical protein